MSARQRRKLGSSSSADSERHNHSAVKGRRVDDSSSLSVDVHYSFEKKNKIGCCKSFRFGIGVEHEFEDAETVREVSLPKRWCHFCCNPFTRRYRYRPVVNPVLTLIFMFVMTILFFVIAILLGTIYEGSYPKCEIEYPSFTSDLSGDAEIHLAWDFPWVKPGIPTCDPIQGCYRDDVVTLAPSMCQNLFTSEQYEEASLAMGVTTDHIDQDYYVKKPDGITGGHLMPGPIGLYYSIKPFYQNHRRYVLSRNSYQLSGEYGWDGRGSGYNAIDPMTICTPLVTLQDLDAQYGIFDENKQPYPGYPSLDNVSDNWSEVLLYPCGLQAFTVFNDTLSMAEYDVDTVVGTAISLDERGESISAAPDLAMFKAVTKYNIPKDSEGKDLIYQWLPSFLAADEDIMDVSNPHFINWMRLGLNDAIIKLYAKVEGYDAETPLSLPVNVIVRNRYNVTGWDGKKSIILSTYGEFGSVSRTNTWIFYVIGSVSLAFSLLFCTKHLLNPRKPGVIKKHKINE